MLKPPPAPPPRVKSDSVCPLCGAHVPVAGVDMCSACAQVMGSVNVIPAKTVKRATPPPIKGPKPSIFGNFGDYAIETELARGGMGVVYVAWQHSLNRRVALKMILTPFAGADEKRRFQAEAEHAATLEHPNIIPVYDCGEVDGVSYFTMKLIDGRGLNEELRRLVLNPRKGIAILTTVARAVHHAHQRGILHRDLKPANILIDAQGVPYVGDFGLAKRVENKGGDLTQPGAIMGTPQYMPPEQASDSTLVTTASDVYSLGAILYEMLTLRVPFEAPASWEILHKVKTEEPRPPRSLRRSVDRDLEAICLKCLEKDPARRYASADALACELERWLRGEPIQARRHSLWERGVKWARRRPAAACSAALAALLLFAVVAFSWRSGELLRQAEQKKLDERNHAAELASSDGAKALHTAVDSAEKNRAGDSEAALIEAEDRFREALFNRPGDTVAEMGLRETALLSFEASLRERNWRQAREKLLLARGAKLNADEFTLKQALLTRLESERGNLIRARVKELMDDAASVKRSVLHEMAVNELIALKDTLTAELLAEHIDDAHPECRQLAFAALTWIGDGSLLPRILPYIKPRTPSGEENPQYVQEAALCAVCKLAGPNDKAAYEAVHQRIKMEPENVYSPLFNTIKMYYRPFVEHMDPGTPNPLSANELRQHAQHLKEAHHDQEALKYFDAALKVDPEDLGALNDRGLLRQELGDFKGALSDLDTLIRIEPKLPKPFGLRAAIKTSLHDIPGAMADYSRAIELDPQSSFFHGNRGMCREQTGDDAGAMADFEKALQLSPKNAVYLYDRGNIHFKHKEYDAAQADYGKALEIDPHSTMARINLAILKHTRGDLDGAIAELDKGIEMDPASDAAYAERAHVRILKSDYAGAIRDYDRTIGINATKAEYWYNRGQCKHALNDFSGAIADYSKAVEINPKRADAWINRGQAKFETGDLKGALKDLDAGLALNPNKKEGLIPRGNIRMELGDKKGAAEDFGRALKSDPRNLKMRFVHANLLRDCGQTKEVLDECNAMLKQAPGHPQVFELLKKLSEEENDPAILDTLALTLFRNGKKAEAIGAVKQALTLIPGDAGEPQRKLREELEAHLSEFKAKQ